MTTKEVEHIVQNGLFPGPADHVSLVETHISWVILTDKYAFKLKKPVSFSFLDFSTCARRKYFLEQELLLNRRLAPQVYLEVLPVGANGIGDNSPPVTDYALKMQRLDNVREMDRLLERDAVTPEDMTQLAALLADFHQQHRLPADTSLDMAQMESDFADLFSFTDDLISLRAPDAANKILSWQSQMPAFLRAHALRLQARLKSGFGVDGHGDLHSRNIFLPEGQPPVVFDCLEFNAHFRQSDVLNELAFFCMDLEYYGRKDLTEHFLQTYNSVWNCFEQPEDELLFTYFKAYRANIRLKVTLLQLRQHPEDAQVASVALKYWVLLCGYVQRLF